MYVLFTYFFGKFQNLFAFHSIPLQVVYFQISSAYIENVSYMIYSLAIPHSQLL